jgi:hypothetical protein
MPKEPLDRPFPNCSKCQRALNLRESDLKTPYFLNNSLNPLIVNVKGHMNKWRCPWPDCHFINRVAGTYFIPPFKAEVKPG